MDIVERFRHLQGDISEETGRIHCVECEIWISPSWWERHVIRWHVDIEARFDLGKMQADALLET